MRPFTRSLSISLACVLILNACKKQESSESNNRVRQAVTDTDTTSSDTTGELYYEVAGSGESVVLLHGGLMDSRVWEQQFAEFQQSYRVLRCDLRGFGRTPAPTEPFSHVADLLTILDKEGIAKAILVGHSMGGALAFDFALTHPERVKAIVAITPSLSGYRYSQSFRDKAGALYTTGLNKSAQEAVRLLFEDSFWDYFVPSEDHPEARALFRELALSNADVFKLDAKLLQRLKPAAKERLDQIQVPVLLVAASEDHEDNIAVVDLLAEKLPKVRKVTIEAGHMVNLERPDEFKAMVDEFLSDLSSNGAR